MAFYNVRKCAHSYSNSNFITFLSEFGIIVSPCERRQKQSGGKLTHHELFPVDRGSASLLLLFQDDFKEQRPFLANCGQQWPKRSEAGC